MPTPLKGTEGSITVGGTSVTWVGEWEVTLENGGQEIGPHVGDATVYEVDTSQKWTFSMSGTIPSAGDTGQDSIFSNATARTNPTLVFEQSLGKRLSFSAAKFNSLTFGVAADGSQTFSAEGSNGSGTVTLAQDT